MTTRDQLSDETNASIDTLLAEAKEADRHLAWVVVREDDWEVINDPRDGENGVVVSLFMVGRPNGSDYYAMDEGVEGGISYSIDTGGCLHVRRTPATRDADDHDLLSSYSPSGWHTVRRLAPRPSN